MQVVTVANSHHRRRLKPSPSERARCSEILGRRDLHVFGIAFDNMHWKAEALDQHRFIGRIDVFRLRSAPARECRAETPAASARETRSRAGWWRESGASRRRRGSPACLTVSRTADRRNRRAMVLRAINRAVDHARASQTAAPRRESR